MALDDKLAACMKCGVCQSVCPVFDETMMGADVIHGRLALLERLAHRLIEDPDAVNEKLSRCLPCGSCQANCPSGVSTLEIFTEARAIVAVYKGLSPLKKAIFRTLLPNPKLFGFLLKIGALFQGPAMRDDNNARGTATCSPLLRPFLGERHMQSLAKQTLSARIGAVNSPTGRSRCKVAFFPGCMGDKIFTNVSEACLKVFGCHEVGVYLSTNYSCCDIPAFSSGDLKGFEKMVTYNVDVLKEGSFDLIATPCSSRTKTIRSLWPKMAGKMPYKHRDAINELS